MFVVKRRGTLHGKLDAAFYEGAVTSTRSDGVSHDLDRSATLPEITVIQRGGRPTVTPGSATRG